jgi:carnitine monooxygenase subunit
MNDYVKPPAELLSDIGKFDPLVAETSWTLPSSWYHAPQIYQLERQRIFGKTWCYQCHQSELADPGDEYYGRVEDQPVTIKRLPSQGLQAFRSPGDTPVAVEVLAGFVFVNLDTAAVALKRQCAKFVDDVYRCCPRIDELRPHRRIERVVAANWKTLIDNNHECYHCAANHKSLMKLVDYRNQALWSDDGITFSHEVKRRQLDNPAYRLDPARIEQDSLFGYIWPTLIPLWFPGSASAVLFQVIPNGPESSIARHDFYFTDATLSPQELAFIDYIDRELVPEDVALCEAVQRGLHSRGYRQGKLVVDRAHPEYSEHHVHFFQQLVYRALLQQSPATLSG